MDSWVCYHLSSGFQSHGRYLSLTQGAPPLRRPWALLLNRFTVINTGAPPSRPPLVLGQFCSNLCKFQYGNCANRFFDPASVNRSYLKHQVNRVDSQSRTFCSRNELSNHCCIVLDAVENDTIDEPLYLYGL